MGKTTVRNDALARIASAVKSIRGQQEAAHGNGCQAKPFSPSATFKTVCELNNMSGCLPQISGRS
jgi:hypothetical protein